MRLSLFTFNMYYDESIYIIREKILELDTLSVNVTKYYKLIMTTLIHLENVKNEFDEHCRGRNITDEPSTLKFAYRGSRPDKLKFNQHYLLRPVLTMYTFYTYTLLYVD